MNKLCLLLLATISSCSNVYAVELPSSMRETMATNVVGMPSMLNLVISMAVVIGMIYLTGFVYSKLNVINRSKLAGLTKDEKDKHKFTVLQSLPLGQQRHIYSLEMDGKIFLVGSTPNQISLIKEFDQETTNTDIENELKSQVSAEPEVDKESSINISELYKKYKN